MRNDFSRVSITILLSDKNFCSVCFAVDISSHWQKKMLFATPSGNNRVRAIAFSFGRFYSRSFFSRRAHFTLGVSLSLSLFLYHHCRNRTLSENYFGAKCFSSETNPTGLGKSKQKSDPTVVDGTSDSVETRKAEIRKVFVQMLTHKTRTTASFDFVFIDRKLKSEILLSFLQLHPIEWANDDDGGDRENYSFW